MTADRPRKIAIVLPVYNDWDAFAQVLEELGRLPELTRHELHVIAVDDSSSQPADLAALQARKGSIAELRVIPLVCNLGHQRAIAVGLVAATRLRGLDAVVVMDSDGEDLPRDVPRLIAAWEENPGRVVVARRGLRREGLTFRLFYALYKMLFLLVAGQTVNYGNFCLLPRRAVESLVYNPAIWNNLAAALSRARLPSVGVRIDRGTRLAGRPQMNFVSLVLHGVSAISVYAEVVLIRIIAVTSLISALVLGGMITVVGIKLFTDAAIPGWASTLTLTLAVILFQAILLAAVAIFQLLSARSLKPFVPALDAGAYVQAEAAPGP